MDEVVFVRLIDHPLKAAPIQAEGQVDDGPNWSRDRNAMAGGGVGLLEGRTAGGLEAAAATVGKAGWRELDCGASRLAEAPKGSGAGVTDYGAVATGKDCRHPASVLTEGWAADRIDTTPHLVKSSARDPVLDPVWSESEHQQLPPRHHIVLPLHEPPHLARP